VVGRGHCRDGAGAPTRAGDFARVEHLLQAGLNRCVPRIRGHRALVFHGAVVGVGQEFLILDRDEVHEVLVDCAACDELVQRDGLCVAHGGLVRYPETLC
jgi:hypothetical protein